MQTGLINTFGNSRYNYYKQIFNNSVVREFATRVGSNADLLNQLQVEKDYKSYKGGRKLRRQFRAGDTEAFAGMIENNIPFREKDFNVLRGMIDSKERLLISLNDKRFTLTHENLKKGGKMYNSLKYMYTSYYLNQFGSDKAKQEIIKGIEEGKGRYGLPKDPSLRQKVQGQVDVLSNEPMQLRIGPEIVEKIRLALPDEMYEESNKGLINWFHTLLYQIPAQEFLEVIGQAISEDESKVKKATARFKEIMREAQQLKSDFEDYQEEEGSDLDNYGGGDDDDDDDGLDDFLGSLGISRPK